MFVNHTSREINVRIVYCGPCGSGAAENLRALHARLPAESRGALFATTWSRRGVLFFDFLPPGLGAVRGYAIRVHVYAFDAERPGGDPCDLHFQDVDGVVFVADERAARFEANLAAMERARNSLAARNYDPSAVPLVIQVFRRGAEGGVSLAEIRAAIDHGVYPAVEAAADGAGVFDTLKSVLRSTLAAMAKSALHEWEETPEQKRRGEAFLARARITGHYGAYFGEATDELGAAADPRDDAFVIMVHGATATRPWVAFGTAGFSLTPRAAAGDDSRLELVAYASKVDGALAHALAALGNLVVRPAPGEAALSTYHLVKLDDPRHAYRDFVLVPPPEGEAFGRFTDAMFSTWATGGREAAVTVSFLQAVPITAEMAQAARAEGGEAWWRRALAAGVDARTGWEDWFRGKG